MKKIVKKERAPIGARVVPGLTPEQEIKLVRECYDNFPEASISLSCQKWNYKGFNFVFVDYEDGKEHVVTLNDAVRGLRVFVGLVNAGKLPGLGLPAGYLSDTGLWDGSAFDALLQCAIFGEVIYG